MTAAMAEAHDATSSVPSSVATKIRYITLHAMFSAFH